MDFIKINDDLNSIDIVKIIDKNIKIATHIRSEIDNLTTFKIVENTIELEEDNKNSQEKLPTKLEDDYKDLLEYYVEDYKKVTNLTELSEILPSKNNYHYKDIILRLQAESIREIKDLEELAIFEDDENVLFDIKKSLIFEKGKISYLKNNLIENDKIDYKEEKKNKIVLVPSNSGRIMILDDLEHISSEYYLSFLELINSIVDNTFKGVKRLNSGLYQGISICEVRGDAIRILFNRLNKDTYALISAFIKKTDSNRGYKEYLKNKILTYKKNYFYIKSLLNDEEFQEKNNLNINNLYNLLSDNIKVYKKGDFND